MLSVNSNYPSLAAQNATSNTNKALQTVMAELSSGVSINSAADNPAGSAQVAALTAQINGSDQAILNANDGISLLQTADGAASQLQDNVQQLRTLAVAAGDGALSTQDRAAIQDQVNQLVQANTSIVNTANFNGIPLLQGGQSQTFQIGPNASAPNQVSTPAVDLTANPASGGLNAIAGSGSVIDVSSPANVALTLSNADNDISTLSSLRGQYGAGITGLSSAASSQQTSSINESATRSAIQDTDYASAVSNLVRDQILHNAGIATQAQANASSENVLQLLR